MNRTVWIARLVAFLMILGFAIVMMNLHAKLRRLQTTSPPAASPR